MAVFKVAGRESVPSAQRPQFMHSQRLIFLQALASLAWADGFLDSRQDRYGA